MSTKNKLIILSNEERRAINFEVLAIKHECSSEYVQLILKGERSQKGEKAKAILKDGKAIADIALGKSNDNTHRLVHEEATKKSKQDPFYTVGA